MSRRLLATAAGVALLGMLAVTVGASLDRSVFDAGEVLADPWGLATLVDAYLAFLLGWLWIAAGERTWPRRLAWLGAVLCLGSMALAAALLRKTLAAPPGTAWREILRPSATDTGGSS